MPQKSQDCPSEWEAHWASKLVYVYVYDHNFLLKNSSLWSPFLMGKSTISMAMASIAFCMFTRPGNF